MLRDVEFARAVADGLALDRRSLWGWKKKEKSNDQPPKQGFWSKMKSRFRRGGRNQGADQTKAGGAPTNPNEEPPQNGPGQQHPQDHYGNAASSYPDHEQGAGQPPGARPASSDYGSAEDGHPPSHQEGPPGWI